MSSLGEQTETTSADLAIKTVCKRYPSKRTSLSLSLGNDWTIDTIDCPVSTSYLYDNMRWLMCCYMTVYIKVTVSTICFLWLCTYISIAHIYTRYICAIQYVYAIPIWGISNSTHFLVRLLSHRPFFSMPTRRLSKTHACGKNWMARTSFAKQVMLRNPWRIPWSDILQVFVSSI